MRIKEKMEPIYIADYNYPLPDERIAKYPLAERDHSKLLVYKPSDVQSDNVQCTKGIVTEDQFYNVGDYIADGSLLVYNNTRVIQARLEFHKRRASAGEDAMQGQGARIEVFCLEPLAPHDYQLSLGSTTGCTWKCMIGNAKKWKDGPIELSIANGSKPITLRAYKGETIGNAYSVRFEWDGENISFAEILDAIGELPIPPYLNRKTEESDKTTYQTVYSRI